MSRADRLFALVQYLCSPRRRTLAEITSELATSARSIYRDLADLEARGVAIERVNGTYRLMDGARPAALPLTARERLLLAMVLEDPSVAGQRAFAASAKALRQKLASSTSKSPFKLAGPDRSGVIQPEIATGIEEAIDNRHSVSILYTSLTDGSARWRGIDPWMVMFRSESWYLIGRCHLHEEPRTFRLDRVSGVLPMGKAFERPESFDPTTWFGASWGVESSGDAIEVRILFSSEVAPLIEFGRHHPTEEKHRMPDGRLDYRVRLGPLEEIARWIVGFGGGAVAVAPIQLVKRVRAIAEGALNIHRLRARPVAARSVKTNESRRKALPHALTDSGSDHQ